VDGGARRVTLHWTSLIRELENWLEAICLAQVGRPG